MKSSMRQLQLGLVLGLVFVAVMVAIGVLFTPDDNNDEGQPVPAGVGGVIDKLAVINQQYNVIVLPDSNYAPYVAGLDVRGRWTLGDWDGDGLMTPGVYSEGVFWYTNRVGTSFTWIGLWIGPGDGKPVVGRFDYVPHDCVGIVHQDLAMWWTCDMTSDPPSVRGHWVGPQLETQAVGERMYVAGDWNGDGIDTVAIRRGPLVTWTNDRPTEGMGRFIHAQHIGAPYDKEEYGWIVGGDWDGDGIDSFGLHYEDGMFFWRDDLEWNTGGHEWKLTTPGPSAVRWRRPEQNPFGDIGG